MRRFLTISIIIISGNLIILAQKYFETELQLYFLGFRINLFFLVSVFLIILNKQNLTLISNFFKNPGKFTDWIKIISVSVFITGIIFLLVYLSGFVKVKQPQFFIEFFVTALTDFPIYYLWNLPFLLSLIILIQVVNTNPNWFNSLYFSVLFTLSVIGAAIEINKFQIPTLNYSNLIIFFAIVYWTYAIHKHYQSIWLTAFSIMTTIYSYILIFGSKNQFLIKTFFARNYEEWQGLLLYKGIEKEIVTISFSFLIIVFGIFFFIFDKRKSRYK